MNIDTNVLAMIAVALPVIALIVVALRRASNRQYMGANMANTPPPAAAPAQSCNCGGCNCAPPPSESCVPAIQCRPPAARPVAIAGLTCDPSDPNFVYAEDIQSIVDDMNERKAIQRRESARRAIASVVAD